ncbi:MAG: hypothetical protein M1823_000789 [Watsoniomyces obsoletus]|nr:MAG: hypothetical protein M1823_000789 [Watsoniomyces obsoletus]
MAESTMDPTIGPNLDPAEREARITQVHEVTGLDRDESEQFLNALNWDVEAAAADYFATQEYLEPFPMEEDDEEGEEVEEDDGEEEEEKLQGSSRGAGRVLGDGSEVPASTASKSKASSAESKKKATQAPRRGGIATLSDLNPSHSHNHDHDDDDEDDEDDENEKDKGRDLYAGGGKSGLAVKDPTDPRQTVKGIIDRAKKNTSTPSEDASGRPTRFSGAGQTLGGDDTPSRTIPDPNARPPKPANRVARTLHFWQNGFSVEDGPLYRFDDPQSAPILALIKSGRAPLNIMGVEADQPVDVTVAQHSGDYVQPKKKYTPFSSGGRRLGLPVHLMRANENSGTTGPGPLPAKASGNRQIYPHISSDTIFGSSPDDDPVARVENFTQSLPIVNLQFRLSNGRRIAAQFNTTHTIGDVYDFVRLSYPTCDMGQPWVLMTTFPSTELLDKEVKLGDMPEFRRGGVMVHKWKNGYGGVPGYAEGGRDSIRKDGN